ncbi:hypothetical protein ACOZ4N_01010 (plasmid) [Halorientalis pallida]|uniref:hypothetical protein n=1 Tax=Halorientalis pallida TaxID=2479928 RepID=UPI003C6ED834
MRYSLIRGVRSTQWLTARSILADTPLPGPSLTVQESIRKREYWTSDVERETGWNSPATAVLGPSDWIDNRLDETPSVGT